MGRQSPCIVTISIHAPRAGGDVPLPLHRSQQSGFQSTPPRAGGDPTPQIVTAGAGVFQSTPPVRGATIFGITHNTPHKNFNPRPPCGGRLTKLDRWSRKVKISIHAPRAGGDFILTSPRSVFSIISIHAPRAGGDGYFVAVQPVTWLFQSTPPVRGRPSQSGYLAMR